MNYVEVNGKNFNSQEIELLKKNQSNSILYLFDPEDELYRWFNHFYKIDLENLLHEDSNMMYELLHLENGEKYSKMLFILPHQKLESNLNHNVNVLVILKSEDKLIVVTRKKEKYISDFFKNNLGTLDGDESVFARLLNASVKKMIKEVRKTKEQISLLEKKIQTSGPIRTIFNEILQLKKYFILLNFAIKSDESLLNLIKKEEKSIIKETKINHELEMIEEELKTLKNLVEAYNQYLSSLDTIINNIGSFQLNNIMKTLTEISIVLTIPTITYGFWGINLKLPF